MKSIQIVALSAALIVSSGAFAQSSSQGLTRAEVRAQLIKAEQNGSRLVTDASYPDVSPIYQNQVTHRTTADNNAYGGASAGSSMSAQRSMTGQCVGPVSFCNIYSGS